MNNLTKYLLQLLFDHSGILKGFKILVLPAFTLSKHSNCLKDSEAWFGRPPLQPATEAEFCQHTLFQSFIPLVRGR
jgi:hypothetical protein